MLEAIIFDMDGVLIDSHPVHRRAWRQFLNTVGKDVREEELDFILEGRRREEILRHFLGELPDTALAEYGLRKDQFFEEKFREIRLIPGIRRFLDRLEAAGVQTAIATSASSSRTWGTLQRLNLNKKFATIVTGDDVTIGKPDPAVYQLASRRMNITAGKILVLEDAPCGVQAAKSAGMRCIGVAQSSRADALLRAGADSVISHFLDLSVEKLIQLWITINRDNPRRRIPGFSAGNHYGPPISS
jgi:beta-phosphoglucomutase